MQNNLQGGNPVFRNGSLTIDYQMQTVYVKEGEIASLRVHVATVRKKIEKKDNLNKCIKTHVGIGYCMVKQEERTVQ